MVNTQAPTPTPAAPPSSTPHRRNLASTDRHQAMILLSGGTLGLAFEVGMGVATVLGSAHGAYAATREAEYAAWLWRTDRTAWRQYVRNARRLA